MNSLLKDITLILVLLMGIILQAHAKNAMHIVISNHLGAPEMLIDENQQVVWQAEYDEFGKATILVEEVEFNHRFPGQYYDKETGLSYNYYRDYDPSLGRYVQSDPIGLAGGINTYGYVGGNPVMYTDPYGLETYQCTKPLNAVTEKAGKKTARIAHDNIPYMYHQYSCIIRDGKVICGGQDKGDGGKGKPSVDTMEAAASCELMQTDNDCFENCLIEEWAKPRPAYGIPRGIDCQDYDDMVNEKCKKYCGLDKKWWKK